MTLLPTAPKQPHSKLLTDLERYNIVIKQSVSLPGSVDGLQNRDLGDELRKLKVSFNLIYSAGRPTEWTTADREQTSPPLIYAARPLMGRHAVNWTVRARRAHKQSGPRKLGFTRARRVMQIICDR